MPGLTHRHRACARQRGAADFALAGVQKHYPPDLELEPVHLDIDLEVSLRSRTVGGTVTTTVEARREGADGLRLDAVDFEDLAVRDPDGRELAWSYDGRELALRWAAPLSRGERRRVAVTYRVERPTSGLYFSGPTDAYPEEASFAATDHETERARHWLPCIDLPSARPRLDFHLRAESRFTILANGALTGETQHADGTKTAHWHLDYPCPSYLTCFVVGDLVRADDGDFGGRPVATFATAGHTPEDLRRSFGRTGEMLGWMTARLGMDFPFPKYFQFALPGFGGAMENISLVSWDDSFVLDEALAREWTRLVDEINVHEMAHSYFGDAVVIRDYAHAWLKESWATYLEQVWFEDRAGPDEQRYQYLRDATAYFQEADERYQRPIVTREFSSSWDMYDRHLYPGGACRLHTLRTHVGDGPFWAATSDYLHQYAGRVVETEDFRRLMEAHSGLSLGRFFDQWFYTAGYPAIKVTFAHDAQRGEGTFTIEQTQASPPSPPSPAGSANGAAPAAGAFVLATDVGWVVDGELHTRPVRLEEARHTVVVPMAHSPEQVRFDPHAKVLHKLDFNPGVDLLRRQLAEAGDVIGRILAGRELAKTGARKNLEAVRDAYRREPFWGVRVELARALAKAGGEVAVEALAELVGEEDDPMVQEGLILAAGQLRDARVRQAVADRLAAGLLPRATAAAYTALGAQRDEAPLDLLAAAAGREGVGGITQSAALRALAASRQPAAIPLLVAAAAYGATTNRARPAAVAALGEIGRHQERPMRERLVERLVDLLRDPNRRVRNAAVAALEGLREGAAIPALEAYRGGLAVQEQVRIDRVLKAIRGGDEPRIDALEKQLEEMRDKLRRVHDTVEHLEARLGVADGSGTPPEPGAALEPEAAAAAIVAESGPSPDGGQRGEVAAPAEDLPDGNVAALPVAPGEPVAPPPAPEPPEPAPGAPMEPQGGVEPWGGDPDAGPRGG